MSDGGRYGPDGRLPRGAPPASVGPTRRSWTARLVVVASGIVAIAAAIALTVVLRDGDDHETMRRLRLPVAEGSDGGEGGTLDATVPDQPLNILLIGSDERSGAEAAEVPGRRSDTIAVVRLDPRSHRPRLLSIPRDLWVTIADTNEPGKVNGAFGSGGPDRLIRTLRENLALPIHRYVEVDFEGFRALVDLVGGVELDFENPTRDASTGFAVEEAGAAHLDGDAALRYARSRSIQVQVGGRWSSDGTGDIGRIRRQQDLLRALAEQVARSSKGKPGALDDLLVAMGPHLTIDAEFPLVELLGLVKAYIDTDPDRVEMEVLPTSSDRVGAQSILRLDADGAAEVLARFGATGPPRVPEDDTPDTATTGSTSSTSVVPEPSPPSTTTETTATTLPRPVITTDPPPATSSTVTTITGPTSTSTSSPGEDADADDVDG